jgi:NTE family protein
MDLDGQAGPNEDDPEDMDGEQPAQQDARSSSRSEYGGRPRLGLALGAGVARGWAHIGVIKALTRYGIKPDFISGTSIGAVVGGIHAAGKLEALETWARGMNRLRMLRQLDLRLSGGGLLGGEKLARTMRAELGETRIEDLLLGFSAVAGDLVTGHEVWLEEGDLVDSIRASMSLPGVFHPVKHKGRWLVDGAIVNPVPVSPCRALGAQIVIAVNLNMDLIGQIRSNSGPVPRVAGFDIIPEVAEASPKAGLDRLKRAIVSPMSQILFNRERADTPSLFGSMVATLNVVQDRISRSRLAGDPPDVQIAPKVGHIGLMEFDRADELIRLGEAAVESAMQELDDVFAVHGVPGGLGYRY